MVDVVTHSRSPIAIDIITDDQSKKYWASVKVRDHNECWPWVGTTTFKGYGKFLYNGHMIQSHRIAYTLLKGIIPEGLHIDHLCRNPACQNPAHMEAVTCKENIRRGSVYRTHCKEGHLLTEDNVRRVGEGHRLCLTCVEVRRMQGRKPWTPRDPSKPRKPYPLQSLCRRGHPMPDVWVVRKSGVRFRKCAECAKIREGARPSRRPCPSCGAPMYRRRALCPACTTQSVE